jgi:hypothetical protein
VAAAFRQWDLVRHLALLAPSTVAIPDRLDRSVVSVALAGHAWAAAKVLVGLTTTHPPTYEQLNVVEAMEKQEWDLVAMLVYASTALAGATFWWACRYGAPGYVLTAIHAILIDVDPARDGHDTCGPKTIDTLEDVLNGTMTAMKMTFLEIALRHKHWETAATVLVLYPRLARTKNARHVLPLQVAAVQEAPLWLLEQLAAAHPKIATYVDRNGTPLCHVMTRRRHWNCVRALVQARPSICTNCHDSLNISGSGSLLLHAAMTYMAPVHVILALVRAGPFVCNAQGKWSLRAVLTKYAPSLHGEDVQELAAAVTDSSTSTASFPFADADGNTALHIGIQCRHVGFCKMVLRHVTNVFAMNQAGESVIWLASQSRDEHMRQLFASLIATPGTTAPQDWWNTTDHDGRTVLFYAVQARQVEIAHRMVRAGADPNHHGMIDLLNAKDLEMPLALSSVQYGDQRRVLHRRYVMPATVTSVKTAVQDDRSCFAMMSLDLSTGQFVSVHCFQNRPAWHAACAHANLVQRGSSLVIRLVDAFVECPHRDVDDNDDHIYKDDHDAENGQAFVVVEASHETLTLELAWNRGVVHEEPETKDERLIRQRRLLVLTICRAVLHLHESAQCVHLSLVMFTFMTHHYILSSRRNLI